MKSRKTHIIIRLIICGLLLAGLSLPIMDNVLIDAYPEVMEQMDTHDNAHESEEESSTQDMVDQWHHRYITESLIHGQEQSVFARGSEMKSNPLIRILIPPPERS